MFYLFKKCGKTLVIINRVCEFLCNVQTSDEHLIQMKEQVQTLRVDLRLFQWYVLALQRYQQEELCIG